MANPSRDPANLGNNPANPAANPPYSRIMLHNKTVVNGTPLMPLIRYTASNIMKLMAIPEICQIVIDSENPFIKYRTTYSSSGSICLMVCNSLGALRPALVTNATMALVQISATK